MSRINSDNALVHDQDTMLRTIQHAIHIHERLKESVDKEREFLMRGDYQRAARVRRERKKIEHDFVGMQKKIRTISAYGNNNGKNKELAALIDQLKSSILSAVNAVKESITDCEREKNDMLNKINVLRTSKRAVNSYARYGGAV